MLCRFFVSSNNLIFFFFYSSTLIVLYAVPPDASNNDRNSIELANDIFGINATGAGPQDPVNARSQVIRCSKGQLEYVPATGHPLIVNGILEVPISQNVAGVASGTVKNWVAAAAVGEYCHICGSLAQSSISVPTDSAFACLLFFRIIKLHLSRLDRPVLLHSNHARYPR